MAKPWERYQEATTTPVAEGPWSKYAQTSSEEAPGIMDSLKQDAPEIAGSVMGGIAAGPAALAATAFGGPAAGLAVESVGSGVGQAAGDAFKQIYEHATGSPDAPKTSGEAMDRMKGEFYAGAASVPAGKLLGKVAGKVLKPFSERMSPVVKEMMTKISDLGGQMTPGQVMESPVVKFVESVARGGIFSKSIFKPVDAANKMAVKKYSENVAKELSKGVRENLSNGEIGEIVQNSINLGRDAADAVATKLYDDVDSHLGFSSVPTAGVKDFASMLESKAKEIADIGLTDKAKQVIGQISRLDDSLSFSNMHMVRSQLLGEARDAAASGNKQTLTVLSPLIKEVDSAMENAASKISPEAAGMWRDANAFYKTGKEVFENKFIAGLVSDKKAVETLGRSIYKEGNVETINKVKKALSFAKLSDPKINIPQTMGALKQGFFTDMLEKATDQEGKVNYSSILQKLEQKKWDETASALLDHHEAAEVTKFLQLGQRLEGTAGSEAPFQFAQFSALGQLFAGAGAVFSDDSRVKGASVAVLAGPVVLAKALTNKVAARYLTEGITELAENGLTKRAIALAAKVGAVLKENEK